MEATNLKFKAAVVRPVRRATAMTLVAAGAVFAQPAYSVNTGVDLDLSFKPGAAGMGGAAFARPQDISAALYGNPATLTQFEGFHFGVAAAYLKAVVDVWSENFGIRNLSESDAQPYVVPDFAFGIELADGWTFALGVGVNAGLGADYRSDPINLAAGNSDVVSLVVQGDGYRGAATLPLVVELISFGANLGLGVELSPQWAIGLAGTIGFGLAQVGTVGPTTGLAALPLTFQPEGDLIEGLGGNFGGTTSDVHDFGFSGAAGITYTPIPELTFSAMARAPLKYHFRDILFTNVDGAGYQDTELELPFTAAFGIGLELPDRGFLIEVDGMWKDWGNAKLFEDLWESQYAVLVGLQQKIGPWAFRVGYNYAEDLLRKEPNGTIGDFVGVGNVPFGRDVGFVGTTIPALDPTDVSGIVQMTLVPVVWNHTATIGLGYEHPYNEGRSSVRIDLFGQYAFKERDKRETVGVGSHEVEANEWAAGFGITFQYE